MCFDFVTIDFFLPQRGGAFVVTQLVLPRQKGTSDTCEMIDEDQLFEYQMKEDLITLGWIHTHPTQDCFLSSVDIHTQLSYQLMLPEAVAVVMAPQRRPDYGVFSLSRSGLVTIRNCQQVRHAFTFCCFRSFTISSLAWLSCTS